jgi:hypothetical protein
MGGFLDSGMNIALVFFHFMNHCITIIDTKVTGENERA